MSQEQAAWNAYYQKEPEIKRFVPDQDPMEQHRVRLVTRLLPRAKPASAVDIGCGDGHLTSVFRSMGIPRIYGVDLSRERLKFGRSRNPTIRYLQGDVLKLPVADGVVELASIVEVLEHMTDPVAALREVARVSSRYVLVTVPYRSPLQQQLCPHCLEVFFVDGHVQFFTEDSLGSVCAAAGLRVQRMEIYTMPYVRLGRPLAGVLNSGISLIDKGLSIAGMRNGRKGKYLGVLCVKDEDLRPGDRRGDIPRRIPVQAADRTD